MVAQYSFNCPQRRLLDFKQLGDAAPRQCDHLRQLCVVERRLLGRCLQFNEAAGTGHHQVHIHFSGGVFLVTQVEERLTPQDPDTGRRHGLSDRKRFQCAMLYQFPERLQPARHKRR